MTNTPLDALSDQDLLATIGMLAANERQATAQLIAALSELDARKLYLAEGCSSLFTYCTQVLHLSEHAAYGRIEAARAAQRHPVILTLLTAGAITLTTVTLLAPHLTDDNARALLERARHKSRREVEQLIAALRPQPPVPATIRKLPEPAPIRQLLASAKVTETSTLESIEFTSLTSVGQSGTAQRRPATVTPLSPESFKLQFTVSRDVHDKLRAAQHLLRHVIPNGDLAALFERALTLLIADISRRKLGATARPRPMPAPPSPPSRHIPSAVRRVVWARDSGQCAFVGAHGRCTERGFLEFHHVRPYADGGAADSGNVELRCKAHNNHEARLYFRESGA